MAVQDIYSAIPAATTIHNGSIVVNQGGIPKAAFAVVKSDVSYLDETTPTITALTGKYDSRFDDTIIRVTGTVITVA